MNKLLLAAIAGLLSVGAWMQDCSVEAMVNVAQLVQLVHVQHRVLQNVDHHVV